MDLLILQGKGSADTRGAAVPTWGVSILCVWQGRDGASGRRIKVFQQFSNTFQGAVNFRKVGWSNGNFTSSSLARGELGLCPLQELS